MPLFFFYGTLRDADVVRAVLRRPIDNLSVYTALLPGYRAALVKGQSYPALVAETGTAADGIVVAGLTRKDVARLDRYEGSEYGQSDVDVLLVDGAREVTAKTYTPVRGLRTEAGIWSFEDWRQHHKRAFVARIRQGEFA